MPVNDIIKIFETTAESFNNKASDVFHFQYQNNELYRQYVDLTSDPSQIDGIEKIPFLPVSFFKTHPIKTTVFREAEVFESSGTTGAATSRHFVKDISVYQSSFSLAFEKLYGSIDEYCILALLPSYLERGGSSLVYMVKGLMDKSKHPLNGFYLSNGWQLHQHLLQLEAQKQKTILIGVTYALLDFAAAYPMPLTNTMVMETGGMKGRKKELLRTQVHEYLRNAFRVKHIHSEYGMTELLSQAYAKEEGRFVPAPWMKILVGEEDDPATLVATPPKPLTGILHIIDLANIYSCSFIATQDLGKLYPDGSFEVLGRIDNSDIRGCSLLAL